MATTQEVKEALNAKDWAVVDVRTMEEWAGASIKGSFRVGREAPEKAKLQALDLKDVDFSPIRAFRNPHHSSTKSSIFGGGLEQVTNPGQQTNFQVLTKEGVPHKDIYEAFKTGEVGSVVEYKARIDENGKEVFEKGFVYPKSMDSSRIEVRYAEQGGAEKDGLVEIRLRIF